VKVLVLGGCPAEEVAARSGLDAGTLEAWEGLFFDVRWARQGTPWVLEHVVAPEQRRDGRLAAMLKLAHAGGPAAARAVLLAESRVSVGQGVCLFDKRIALHLRCEHAMALPLETERAALFFVCRHAELLARERRLRLEERRLEQRCQEALGKQQRADARLALASRRYEEQAARRAERLARRSLKEEQRRLRQAEELVRATARAQARAERKRRGGSTPPARSWRGSAGTPAPRRRPPAVGASRSSPRR
jgi:hypothetical protein